MNETTPNGPRDGPSTPDDEPGHYVDAEFDDEELDVTPDEADTRTYVDAELEDEDVEAGTEPASYVDAELEDEDVDLDRPPGHYEDVNHDGDGD